MNSPKKTLSFRVTAATLAIHKAGEILGVDPTSVAVDTLRADLLDACKLIRELAQLDEHEREAVPIEAVEETVELFAWYAGQSAPQTVHLCLNPETPLLYAVADPEIGGAVPANVWHGRVLRWRLPLLSGDAATAFIRSAEVQALAVRIIAGYECEWDGSNHVGKLDDDATNASEELELLCEDPDGERLDVQDADEWFGAEEPELVHRFSRGEWADSGSLESWLRSTTVGERTDSGPLVVRGVGKFARNVAEQAAEGQA